MKSSPRLASVDGLRAMAMLMVFTFHCWGFAGRPHFAVHIGTRSFDIAGSAVMGAQGVEVFMVLSGFCLFFPLCFDGKRMHAFDWKEYAVRRVRRIVPPYYAAIGYVLLLHFLVAAAHHLTGRGSAERALPTWFDLVTHLTFTHTLFQSTFFSVAGAFWSLGLEAQFYLVFPLLVWAFARFGWRTIAVVIFISLCYYVLLDTTDGENSYVRGNFILRRLMEFGVGIATALLVARSIQREQITPAWKGVAIIGACLLLFFTSMPDWGPLLSQEALQGSKLSLGVGALLFVVCTSTRSVTFVWSNKVSAFLGLVSYSFFLIHQTTLDYLAQTILRFRPQITPMALFAILMTGGFFLCLAITCVFFQLFEKPFLKNWPSVWVPKRARDVPGAK